VGLQCRRKGFKAGAAKWFAVLILILISCSLHAQTWPSELWHEGRLVLAQGDTLKGFIKYDFQQDLVQYAIRDEQGEAFTARKVLFFEIFDTSIREYRKFFTLPYSTSAGYKSPLFFELLQEGKLTLLAREYLEYKTYSASYGASFTRLVLSYRYFFLKEDGEIDEFTGNRNDLLNLMGRKADEVEKYMKSNRLNIEDRHDFTRVIEYYNSLYGS
jgi:hypothetical protein